MFSLLLELVFYFSPNIPGKIVYYLEFHTVHFHTLLNFKYSYKQFENKNGSNFITNRVVYRSWPLGQEIINVVYWRQFQVPQWCSPTAPAVIVCVCVRGWGGGFLYLDFCIRISVFGYRFITTHKTKIIEDKTHPWLFIFIQLFPKFRIFHSFPTPPIIKGNPIGNSSFEMKGWLFINRIHEIRQEISI